MPETIATDALSPPRARGPQIGIWISALLFFLMLFLPASYQAIKAPLLALVLAMIALQALAHRGLQLHRTVVAWTMLMVFTGLVFMFRGAAHGAPGALKMGGVYALWPLVYLLLIAGAATPGALRMMVRVLVVATIAVGVYGASYIMYVVGVLPASLYIPLEQNQRIGFYQGFVEINIDSIASLLFLIPFLVSALMTWPRTEALIPRRWLWIALLSAIALAALSARRALLLVALLSPVFALLLRQLLPTAEKRASRRIVWQFLLAAPLTIAGLWLALHFAFGVSLSPVVDMFRRGFAFQSYGRAVERKEMFLNLLAGWAKSPLLGSGQGAIAPGWIRSQEQPWAYELSYMALLFHAGLLGFLVYTAGVGWIITMALRIIREGNRLGLCTLSVLVGSLCFLLANAADPYLEKFDYMWVIFLPVALINVWLCSQRPSPLGHGAGS
ncbi:MAG TPA: hypothetical protein VG454_07235 [Gemmatimonadales bacterium]|nr:hypothetical protein [Gemmatimonadales bacterium]